MSCECVSLRLDGLEEKPKTQHKEVNAQCPTQWPATESCFQRKDHPVRVPRPHAPQPHPHAYLERRLQWIQEDRVTAWLETLQNGSKWDCGISRPTISFATRGLQADPSVTQRCNDTMVQPLTPIPSHEAVEKCHVIPVEMCFNALNVATWVLSHLCASTRLHTFAVYDIRYVFIFFGLCGNPH